MLFMKSTDLFKQTIQDYLDTLAQTDELFAVTYAKEGKNIDDCVTYILNSVKKSECNGFADKEIYGMAVHYYDEDIIEIGTAFDGSVVVNHTVVITDEEKSKARKKAVKRLEEEFYHTMKNKPEVKKTPDNPSAQTSLF